MYLTPLAMLPSRWASEGHWGLIGRIDGLSYRGPQYSVIIPAPVAIGLRSFEGMIIGNETTAFPER